MNIIEQWNTDKISQSVKVFYALNVVKITRSFGCEEFVKHFAIYCLVRKI